MGAKLDEVAKSGLIHRLVDSRFAKWVGLIGTILALVSLPFAFDPVQEAVFKKRTELVLEQLSEIPIFDINRPLRGLKVEFQGNDLTALQQGVVVAQVQLRNVGDVSINAQKTTPLDPLGFRIDGGSLVRVTRLTANADHLRRHVKPRYEGNVITLNQGLIFEPGDYVRFDLLITRPLKGSLKFEPMGKVEGLRAIRFQPPSGPSEKPGVIQQSFKGNSVVQLLRAVAYPFLSLTVLVLLLLAGSWVSDFKQNRKREKRRQLAQRVLASLEAPEPLGPFLSDLYVSEGQGGLAALQRSLEGIRRGQPMEQENEIVLPADVEISADLVRSLGSRSGVRRAVAKLEDAGLVKVAEKQVAPAVGKAVKGFQQKLQKEALASQVSIEALEPARGRGDFVRYRVDAAGGLLMMER